MHVYTCVYQRFLLFTYVYVYMNISVCIHVLYICILVLSSFAIAQARWRRTLSSILSSLWWISARTGILCQGSTLSVKWHPSSRLGHVPQPPQRVKVDDDKRCYYHPTSTTSSAQPAKGSLSGHVRVFLFTGLGVRQQERTRSKKIVTPKVLLLKIPCPDRPAQSLDTPHSKKFILHK